jgi:hypothetical protein
MGDLGMHGLQPKSRDTSVGIATRLQFDDQSSRV